MPTSYPSTLSNNSSQSKSAAWQLSSKTFFNKSFTLLELIVVIVVIAVLALLAVPTFSEVMTRVEDENSATTLASLVREASALAAFRGETTYTLTDFTDAVADLPASSPGVTAAAWELDSTSLGWSDTTNTIHVVLGGSPTGQKSGVALRASSGHCALASSSGVGSGAQRWVIQEDLGANCTGHTALLGPAGSETVSPLSPQAATAPDAPTNLIATPKDTEVDLVWEAPDGLPPITGYRVYKDTQVYATSVGPSLTVSGLSNNQSYSFTVTAYNAYGESPPSSAVSETPQPPPPSPPVLTVDVTGTTASLSWPETLITDSYDVRRDGSVVAPNITETSFEDSGLSAATSYTYDVRSCNTGGCSPWSTSVSIDTIPNVPSGLKFTSIDTSTMNLSWDATTAASTYQWVRSPSTDGPNPTGSTAATSLSQGSLSSATSFSYQVKACNAAGCSSLSPSVQNVTGGSLTFDYNGTVQTWNPPTGLTNVRLYVGAGQGASGQMIVDSSTPGSGGWGGQVAIDVSIDHAINYEAIPGNQGTYHWEAWPYGGRGSGGGGAASVFRVASSYQQMVVAGGGGGGGASYRVGGVGGNGGAGGASCCSESQAATSGAGATSWDPGNHGEAYGGSRGHIGVGGARGTATNYANYNIMYGDNGTNANATTYGIGGNGAYGAQYVGGGGGSGYGGGGGGGAVSHVTFGGGVGAGGGGGAGNQLVTGSVGPNGANVWAYAGSRNAQGFVRVCWHGSTACVGTAPTVP